MSWKSSRVRTPKAFCSSLDPFPFDIKTRTCSLTGKAQLLPFNERCSSSPCQQQCVTTTGWCHLVSLRGASAVMQNLQCCHFTLTDKPTWTGYGERPHNGPSSCLPPWKNGIGWHLCLICVLRCILFCCARHSVFTPTVESEHCFHHLSSPTPSPHNPRKALKGHCGGDDRSLPFASYERVPSLCPSSPAWVSPDCRRTGGYSNASWHAEKLWLLRGLCGWTGWTVWVAAEG